MAEKPMHKRAKSKAAGKSGKTEIKLKSGKILDASTRKRATEIERSGSMNALIKAAQRLKESHKKQKVLQVPQKDMSKAAKAMKEVEVGGTVKNMGGTKRRYVPKKK